MTANSPFFEFLELPNNNTLLFFQIKPELRTFLRRNDCFAFDGPASSERLTAGFPTF